MPDCKLTVLGIPGKRTKYQYKDTAQLLVKVTSNRVTDSSGDRRTSSCASKLPKNEPLCDDTVLDKMKLTDESSETVADLTGTEQALLIALWYVCLCLPVVITM